MFCGECGHELPEGARYCGECGTPVPPAPVPPTSAPAHGRPADATGGTVAPRAASKLALIAAVAAVAICATGIAYALIVAPAGQSTALEPAGETARDVSGEAEGDEEVEDQASDDEGEDAPEAESEQVDAVVPAEEPEPEPPAESQVVPAHDFECAYFYLDVPSDWVSSGGESPVPGGPTLWSAEDRGGGEYYFVQSTAFSVGGYVEYETGACTVLVGGSGPGSGAVFFGTTSGGESVYVAEASAGFLYHGYDFQDPSECAVMTLT